MCDMALAIGFKREDNPTAWEFAQRLADLIEPSCDRNALLELADEMEGYSADLYDILPTAEGMLCYARRIRRALGLG